MSLSSESVQKLPTCGVVITKKDGTLEEVLCPEVAAQLISIVNPENQAEVTAVILVCEKHDHDLEAGKTLIFKSENQDERIAVQFSKVGESNVPI